MESIVNMEVTQHCRVPYSQVSVARHRPPAVMLSGTELSAVPDMGLGGKVVANHNILLQHYAGRFLTYLLLNVLKEKSLTLMKPSPVWVFYLLFFFPLQSNAANFATVCVFRPGHIQQNADWI